MAKQRPKNGTLAWFDSLSKRDFDNGATLDEIAKVYKQRDALLAACKRLVGLIEAQVGTCFCEDTEGRGLGKCLPCEARDAISKAETW